MNKRVMSTLILTFMLTNLRLNTILFISLIRPLLERFTTLYYTKIQDKISEG